MSFLEKKIRDNTGYFDNRQPPEGHQQRFLDKLNDSMKVEEKSDRYMIIFKIAAVSLIFVLISSFFLTKNFLMDTLSQKGSAVLLEVIKIEFSEELETTFAYYDSKAEPRIDQIADLAPNEEEAARIKQSAQEKMQNIDADMASIEKEYMSNSGNKKLEAALINLKRQKAEVMETILKQLNANISTNNNTTTN